MPPIANAMRARSKNNPGTKKEKKGARPAAICYLPQDGSWAIFAPATYKNMVLGEAELAGANRAALFFRTF
jgi:hypothetical protein